MRLRGVLGPGCGRQSRLPQLEVYLLSAQLPPSPTLWVPWVATGKQLKLSGFKEQKWTPSQCWRPDVPSQQGCSLLRLQGKMLQALLPALVASGVSGPIDGHLLLASSQHLPFTPVHLCVLMSLFYKDTSHCIRAHPYDLILYMTA